MRTPFDHAVTEHGAVVLRVCRAALGPGPDADDAWSETFLAALRGWEDLPDDANVQAWLVRIAQRKAVDQTRARSRGPIPTATVPEPGHTRPGPAAPAVGSDLGAGSGRTDIWDAVAALPERQRLAVAYHWFGGLPHAETAALIGGTPAAVRRAAADGIAALRRTLTNDPEWSIR